MALNRRNWLKLAGSGPALPGIGWFGIPAKLRRRFVPITATERAVVARIVDLLVPADETPGALQLGIDRTLLAEFESHPREAQRLSEALAWLDGEARTTGADDFLALDEAQQITLLTRMEAAPAGSAPAVIFRTLRQVTMSRYYAHPGTWPMLGFDGPPQPVGFPDYAMPPRSRAD